MTCPETKQIIRTNEVIPGRGLRFLAGKQVVEAAHPGLSDVERPQCSNCVQTSLGPGFSSKWQLKDV